VTHVIDPHANADEDGCLSRACGDYGEESMPMHGEYKEPGGKLVVVDLVVSGGRLSDVRVSGDFFLEPDSALDLINRALVGTRADAGVDAWATAVRTALGDGASLYGISAEGVAIAVERAVNGEAAP